MMKELIPMRLLNELDPTFIIRLRSVRSYESITIKRPDKIVLKSTFPFIGKQKQEPVTCPGRFRLSNCTVETNIKLEMPNFEDGTFTKYMFLDKENDQRYHGVLPFDEFELDVGRYLYVCSVDHITDVAHEGFGQIQT